jgi:hypothetical protein
VADVAIFPRFAAEERAKGLTDFNDLATQNPEVVSRQLNELLADHGTRRSGNAIARVGEVKSEEKWEISYEASFRNFVGATAVVGLCGCY